MFFSQAMELTFTQINTTSSDSNLLTIPSEYHEYTELFSDKEVEKLLLHCPYNHQIPLKPSATPPFGIIYFMSPTELETLQKYIVKNLKKGFIHHSQSLCEVPILFMKKLDSTLR